MPVVFGARGQTGEGGAGADRVAPDRTTGGRGIDAVLVIRDSGAGSPGYGGAGGLTRGSIGGDTRVQPRGGRRRTD